MKAGFFTGNAFVQRIFMIANLVCFTVAWIISLSSVHPPSLCFRLFAVLSSLIFACALIPWYDKPYRGLGIEDHFAKIAMGVNYAALLVNLLQLSQATNLASLLSSIFSVLLIALIAINAVLIKYHFCDPDKTPPAYFAANLYLHDTADNKPSTT